MSAIGGGISTLLGEGGANIYQHKSNIFSNRYLLIILVVFIL